MCFKEIALYWFHAAPENQIRDYQEEYRRKLLNRLQGTNEPYLSYCHEILYLCLQVNYQVPESEKIQ